MRKTFLRVAKTIAICAGLSIYSATSTAADKTIEATAVTNLNLIADCLHHFDEYDAPKLGATYYDVDITCAGHMAYLKYARKVEHKNDG